MLEGSPGVGKTSIIETLGSITRNKVVRINLSEQTDLSELFGADLPAINPENKQQHFQWIDGPFLLALKQGHWVILDEINLASQSVLEGLNSCFDHRGEIFISELNRKFTINKTQTKIFACQNPYLQGGGRKGLPKSFLNRFSKVYINKMSSDDLFDILSTSYHDNHSIPKDVIQKMIQFNTELNQQITIEKKFGSSGAPWEFNLRDLFRWCDIITKEQDLTKEINPGDYIHLIYAARFRTQSDRDQIYLIFKQIFGYEAYKQEQSLNLRFAETHLQIGQSFLQYKNSPIKSIQNKYSFTNSNLKYLESIIKCIEMNWMTILVGHSCVGKTTLIRMLSQLINQPVIEFSVNNATDTSDLLGGFAKTEHFKNDSEFILDTIESIYIRLIEIKLEQKQNSLKTFESLMHLYLKFKFETINSSDDMLLSLLDKNLK